MAAGPEPTLPPSDAPPESVEIIDPRTGQPVPTQDMRETFARISAEQGHDPAAARAFIEGKIDMIRSHPTLSAAEKAAAIRELETALEGSS